MRREHEGSAVGAAGDIGGCLMYGYICPTCGAHLDPQERCEECTEQKLKDQRESERIKSLLSVGKDAQYELVLS
jgi:hypothetical protein